MSRDPDAEEGGSAPGWARILSDLAHDLRGAAGAADLWLELLERADDAEKRARATRELKTAIARAATLAADFADAAAVVEGAAEGPALPFELGALVDAGVHRAEVEAISRRVALAVDFPAGFGHRIVGNEAEWGRALDRLFRAAIAQASPGATLRVRVRGAANGGVELALPYGGPELPATGPLLAAWSAPRAETRAFPLGLVLARAHFARAGGALSTRTDETGTWLVAVTA